MQITAIVGNPKELSRTFTIAREITSQLAVFIEEQGKQLTDQLVIDLAPYAGSIIQWGHPEVQKLLELVAGSDIVIIATPTYKATYTGLLKLFIDMVPPNAWAGKFAIPVMVGGSPHHSMAVETYLRPLLTETGAIVPVRGLYMMESQMEELPAVVSNWIEESRFGLSCML
ncbi:NADPH-dependent FMN reductase [Paenibacillus sinopodophylli]|uniref:NADPH-dependent FMN reductase n=1 Tax=Paenibacillus sinopodophylli TaxID=1837342 RepID=UPI001486C8C3|nr:NAD(P)H-dependent oxidoreductase [Paenibacillus sinopodophylli]